MVRPPSNLRWQWQSHLGVLNSNATFSGDGSTTRSSNEDWTPWLCIRLYVFIHGERGGGAHSHGLTLIGSCRRNEQPSRMGQRRQNLLMLPHLQLAFDGAEESREIDRDRRNRILKPQQALCTTPFSYTTTLPQLSRPHFISDLARSSKKKKKKDTTALQQNSFYLLCAKGDPSLALAGVPTVLCALIPTSPTLPSSSLTFFFNPSVVPSIHLRLPKCAFRIAAIWERGSSGPFGVVEWVAAEEADGERELRVWMRDVREVEVLSRVEEREVASV